MTRLWLLRIARGGGAALLLGGLLGGLEAFWLLLDGLLMLNPIERLSLWGLAVLANGLVGGVFGLVLAAALGAHLGHDEEARGLALDTGRDPRYPWLPWVLGLVTFALLVIQQLPTLFAGDLRVAVAVFAVVVLGSLLLSLALRWFLLRLDSTGKGAALAVLGLPTLLAISSSLVVSAPLAGGKGRSVADRAGLPNLLLISIDGLRADHVGPGSRVDTPNLDWLATRGVWFQQAVTASTGEGPALGSLMVGRHPLAIGYLDDAQALPARLPGAVTEAELPSLAEVLGREGFRRAAFVSSAALDGASSGLDRGFEVYDDDLSSRTRGATRLGIMELLSWLRFAVRGSADLRDVLRPAQDSIEALDFFLDYHYRENLFLWLHLSDLLNPSLEVQAIESERHDPISGPAGRGYAARLVALDQRLGQLVKSMEGRGLMNRTIIAVVGSRGAVPGSPRPSVSEAWLKVPVILYGPGLELEQRIPAQVRLHDLYPTLLAAVGLRRRPRGDAVSLLPLLQGQPLSPLHALSVSPPRSDGRYGVSLRSENRKYVREPGGAQALYDLRSDPRELHDLSQERPADFANLGAQLNRTLGPSTPTAVLPSLDPGRKARLRALATLR